MQGRLASTPHPPPEVMEGWRGRKARRFDPPSRGLSGCRVTTSIKVVATGARMPGGGGAQGRFPSGTHHEGVDGPKETRPALACTRASTSAAKRSRPARSPRSAEEIRRPAPRLDGGTQTAENLTPAGGPAHIGPHGERPRGNSSRIETGGRSRRARQGRTGDRRRSHHERRRAVPLRRSSFAGVTPKRCCCRSRPGPVRELDRLLRISAWFPTASRA